MRTRNEVCKPHASRWCPPYRRHSHPGARRVALDQRGALVDLLVALADDDWAKPTVHADRNVKDLTAHLLHGILRRVTALRDHYNPPTWDIADIDDLTAFIQEDIAIS